LTGTVGGPIGVDAADNDRLDDAVGANRLRQFLQTVIIDVLTRLVRVGHEPIDVEFRGDTT
jgi:hypothetical protein